MSMSMSVTIHELVRGVDECFISTGIAMAKFDAIHHRINTNTGHTVNEDTLGPLFAHFVADLRTALDRMMLVLRASCTADKFLPADIDVRDVAFWYAGKLDQNHPTPAKQPRERAQVAAKKIIVFDENDERADEYNRAVQVLVDSWLEVQAFQEIAPNGDRNFVPLDTEEERKNDYMSLRRQFAYLHFLRNFTAHRGRVIPVTSKGYLCIDRVTMKRELKDVPTNDKNVECIEVAKGLFIYLPIDPRQPGAGSITIPCNILLARFRSMIRLMRHKIMIRVLRRTAPNVEVPDAEPEIQFFWNGWITLNGSRLCYVNVDEYFSFVDQ